jgi:hypothetical protein
MAALSRVVSAFLAICALRADTLAQTAEPGNQTISDQTLRIAQAVRAERPPKLDGTLDDSIWQEAVPITDFWQKEPSSSSSSSSSS